MSISDEELDIIINNDDADSLKPVIPMCDCLEDMLCYSIITNHIKIARLLFSIGIDADPDTDIMYLLGYTEIVRYLLDIGKPYYEWGLSWAIVGGHKEMVKLLLDAGAQYRTDEEKMRGDSLLGFTS